MTTRTYKTWPWNSFTVRKERRSGTTTELAKRARALLRDGTLPEYTLQAYVTLPRRRGHYLSLGLIKTRRLYEYLLAHPDLLERTRTNPQDGNRFAWVDFSEVACDVVLDRTPDEWHGPISIEERRRLRDQATVHAAAHGVPTNEPPPAAPFDADMDATS